MDPAMDPAMAPEMATAMAEAMAHQPGSIPILYSFRRCPYAIRARLALEVAGLRPGLDLELREVALRAKPPELLQASAKGTVPVLVLPANSAQGSTVLDQSLAIMTWALDRHDPGDWQRLGPGPAAAEQRRHMAALIEQNDGPFKYHLDRFKYAGRNPAAEPGEHRAAALAILRQWNRQLEEGGAGNLDGAAGARKMTEEMAGKAAGKRASGDGAKEIAAEMPDEMPQEMVEAGRDCTDLGSVRGPWLLGERPSLADAALLPFVRQFRLADPSGFDAESDLSALQRWLHNGMTWSAIAAMLAPPWGLRQPWRSPSWIYHLAMAEEWQEAQRQGSYRRSTRGLSLEQVGFIHASRADQLAATYQRFYGDAGPVTLLTIDPQRLTAPLRYEPAPQGGGDAGSERSAEAGGEERAEGGELFPHIYGPLPLAAVLATEPFAPGDSP
jgi:glutathione S-transferase